MGIAQNISQIRSPTYDIFWGRPQKMHMLVPYIKGPSNMGPQNMPLKYGATYLGHILGEMAATAIEPALIGIDRRRS